MKIHLNPKMNSKIADIMRVSEQPAQMYGAALIDAYRASGLEPDEIPHWIPVSERLPEAQQRILVRCDVIGTTVGWIMFGKWVTDLGDGVGNITHWMPLPQPPKDGAK